MLFQVLRCGKTAKQGENIPTKRCGHQFVSIPKPPRPQQVWLGFYGAAVGKGTALVYAYYYGLRNLTKIGI